MKTFKLKRLEVVDHDDDEIEQLNIKLRDGLIINREDDQGQWLIEAYTNKSYMDYFKKLHGEQGEIMIQATITKESNEPATFITTVLGINEIGDHINVLFIGTIIDRRKHIIEDLLTDLIDQGYQGRELLSKFKELA
ncbi:YwpF-like family protein [Oceanobacillus polygoni]|uniref:Bifunctional DNA-binding transcriptional regulator/antitoxin component of YhaV-PrlF toxin-antitoxin module n=1 Tax=Oceanobacillus polygoni TaxID=1235259 RepID=A0A9X0YVH5_9BACI|nr:YwpF-like family protein [Oceanobacillus polygoni]MBP2077939.1 bifunctional DNA-binding transcriptional regulator/antitoxin component of YhaV-PrlF toxin-antitoxin module [Oceanobacillus polygoni]